MYFGTRQRSSTRPLRERQRMYANGGRGRNVIPENYSSDFISFLHGVVRLARIWRVCVSGMRHQATDPIRRMLIKKKRKKKKERNANGEFMANDKLEKTCFFFFFCSPLPFRFLLCIFFFLFSAKYASFSWRRNFSSSLFERIVSTIEGFYGPNNVIKAWICIYWRRGKKKKINENYYTCFYAFIFPYNIIASA